MCSINGVFIFGQNNKNIHLKFLDIFKNAENRGRDGYGLTIFNLSNEIQIKKNEKVDKYELETYFDESAFLYLSNNRAEPTTEYFEENISTNDHLQPYSYKNITIVHNGVISNDKELEIKYNIKKLNNIDSSILPILFDKLWVDYTSLNQIKQILTKEILGSFSMAIYNKLNPKSLILTTNYKPLYIMYDFENDCIFFSSQKENFQNDNLFSKSKIEEISPYSILQINKNKAYRSLSLYSNDNKKNKKALIICSSGLDSTVCAKWAQSQGYDISLLHFNYKCKAEKAENKHIVEISKYFNCELITIPVDFFKNTIKNSVLLDDDKSINMTETGAEFALEWVPARNLIFMSIAAGYAEANNFDYIVLGGNLEESGAYPDNEDIFMKKFNDLLPNALAYNKQVQVLSPVSNLMKKEIVQLGLQLNAPLHLTWSCYHDGEVHCGECGPCRMRKKAFKMLNQKEVIKYIK